MSSESGRNVARGKSSSDAAPGSGLNRRYLRLQDLRRLSRVAFLPKRRVEGVYAGRHATPLRGQSIEFRDYRQYMPGDDVGAIDWKVYGRSDRMYIRLFEHQSEQTVHLLVDASASMGYHGLTTRMPSPPRKRRRPAPVRADLSKYDQACFLAAAIGFVLARQHDRFSFQLAQRGLTIAVPPGNSMPHLLGILNAMEQAVPYGVSHLPAAIRSMTGVSGRRDLLIVFSDLLDDPPALQRALAGWRHRGGEVILFQVLHEHELKLPEIDSAQFVDSETGQSTRIQVADVRTAYAAELEAFLESWRRAAVARAIDLNLVSTAVPYFQALERYLVHRATTR